MKAGLLVLLPFFKIWLLFWFEIRRNWSHRQWASHQQEAACTQARSRLYSISHVFMEPAPTVQASPSSHFTHSEVLHLCSGQCESRVGPQTPGPQLDFTLCMYLHFHWTEKRLICWLLLWKLYILLADEIRGLSVTLYCSTGGLNSC